MRIRTILPVTLAVLVAAAACGGSSGNAATFNDTAIPNAQFERELAALKGNKPFITAQSQAGVEIVVDGKLNPELTAQWLASGIEQIPVDAEFTRRKLTITDEARETARKNAVAQLAGASGTPQGEVFDAFPKWFQEMMVGRQARVEAVLNAFVADDGFTSDAAWAEANGAAIAQNCPSGKVVSHVLVKTREDAEAVRARLAGGADFATVAKEVSTDPTAKSNGGSLGCMTSGQFVAPFEAAMQAMAPGTVSEPVQTEFGFHVIRVDTMTGPTAATYVHQLRQQAAGQKFTAWLSEQMTNGKVTVNPKWGSASVENGQLIMSPPTSTTASTAAPTTGAPTTAAPGSTSTSR